MCGIGGFVDYERDARRGGPILHGMKRTLTQRGPDAEGTYFDEDAALVHRRLIVIDPEGGKQPMHSPDGNTIIIYNGELYNTPELRTELMSRGHEFVGHSDTEVLLHAYLEWKTSSLRAQRSAPRTHTRSVEVTMIACVAICARKESSAGSPAGPSISR